MKSNLYICYTQFHLLITLLKCINNKEKNDLIVSSNFLNKTLCDKELIDRITKLNIFDNIIIYDKSDQQNKIENSKFKNLKKFLFTYKEIKQNNINFDKYDDIYIYNDTMLLGDILNKKKIKYHLIEDGTDCFKNNKLVINERKNLKKIVKTIFFKSCEMGTSKFIIDVEVNDKDCFIENKKIIEKPKIDLFNNVKDKDLEIIRKIFNYNIKINDKKNTCLIITQPLSEDEILNEKQKINAYKKIINDYCRDCNIIFKVHPRELTNYKQHFKTKNIEVINEQFPIELIKYNNIHFKKIITISSTAINILDNCDEKIFLGWDWMTKYKECDYNEK